MFYTLYEKRDVGKLILKGDANEIVGVEFYKKNWSNEGLKENRKFFEELINELNNYFDKKLKNFSVNINLANVTPFRKKVYEALLEIPYGEVVSYKELACKIGSPRAQRAVGNALNKNPIAIIVPCHRIISSNGYIGGYGGGVDLKRTLLRIEGVEDV